MSKHVFLRHCAVLPVLLTVACGGPVLFGGNTGGGGSGGSPDADDDGWDDDEWDDDGGESSVPPECVADEDTRWEVQRLYDDTEASVHELVTCGGMMIRLAGSLRLALLATNDDLLNDEARELIGPYLESMGAYTSREFEHRADGSWAMPAGQSPQSWFVVRFYDPNDAAVLTEDVFELDTYLQGVHVQSSHDLDEMLLDPTMKNEFTFTWDTMGPLGHLLNDGKPLEEPFTLRLSLWDLAASTDPSDMGPFASVFDVEMGADIQMVDPRGATMVTYDADTSPTPVAVLAGSGRVDYDVHGLTGKRDDLALVGNAEQLRFASVGLAGKIEYTVEGAGAELYVTSDFGDGQKYPTPEWSCPAID